MSIVKKIANLTKWKAPQRHFGDLAGANPSARFGWKLQIVFQVLVVVSYVTSLFSKPTYMFGKSQSAK